MKNNREQVVEYKKQYHKKNKEQLTEKNKKHYIENKVEVAEKNKKYREKNNQLVECDCCGAVVKKLKLLDHYKTKKHRFAIQFNNYLLL